ncbi:MAG: sulfite exporter TauE/SafE family protein [Roseovarius sp.]|uniref:sulfite exporter TauE/SafE family protein n=1 Tax=Roseovarius sp. TaxID=1486281 RepID=UPI001B593836|nr:sulfite exporter TauE/SafE family protein [Roseovarius sp.]MBQ0752400.1 sulfite exporter TauE/SafE family protein [Roseovarius sp.]MBQ0808898.1 sulfite exporter TauE/SafE family protein [Roseovarius sp.]
MNSDTVLYVITGAAAGGFINGLAGFGTALFALGFFLTVIPPLQAVAMLVVLSVVTGLQGVWVVRDAIGENPRRLARFLLPGLIGIPLGVLILSVIDAGTLKAVVAAMLLLYGGYFTLRARLPRFERSTPFWDMLVGFLGGVLGGAASLSGALPMMWCALRPWPKQETRAVLQPFNVVVLAVTTILLALKGAYTRETLIYLAIAIPAALLAAQLGITVFKRLSDTAFRRLLILMTLVSGVVLLLREML